MVAVWRASPLEDQGSGGHGQSTLENFRSRRTCPDCVRACSDSCVIVVLGIALLLFDECFQEAPCFQVVVPHTGKSGVLPP
jgi:hypothetical protein